MFRFKEYLQALWGPLILGVALRIVYLALYWNTPLSSDPLGYFDAAKHIFETGRVFPNYWPLGTPFALLVGFYLMGVVEYWVVYLVLGFTHVLLICFTVAVGYLIAGKRAGFWAGILAATYLRTANMIWAPESHIFLATSLMGGLTFLIAGIRANSLKLNLILTAISGIFFGYAALTRPSSALFLVLVPLVLLKISTLSLRWRLVQAGVFVGLMALVLVPVGIGNWRAGEGFTLSTNNEANFWLGNNRCTPLIKTWHLASHKPAMKGKKCGGARTRKGLLKSALSHIAQRPDLFVVRTFFRTILFWGIEYEGAYKTFWKKTFVRAVFEGVTLFYIAVWYVVFGVLFISFLIRFWNVLPVWWRVLLPTIVFGYQLPYCFAFAAPIYHVGVMFPLFATAGVLLDKAIESGKRVWNPLVETWITYPNRRLVWGAVGIFIGIQVLSVGVILYYL